MKRIYLITILTGGFFLMNIPALFAQANVAAPPAVSGASPFTMLYIALACLIVVIVFETIVIQKMMNLIEQQNYRLVHGTEMPSKEIEVVATPGTVAGTKTVVKKETLGSRLWKALTRSERKGREKDVVLEHAHDGILELDNQMPPWLQYIFFASIVFAVIYLFVYQVSGIGKSPRQEYADEMRKSAMQKEATLKTAAASVDEISVVALSDEKSLSVGKSIFIAQCSPCHGMKAEGNVGPNLTDDYWLHGGSVNEIFKTVKYGVPAKAMISWNLILPPMQMQEVVSFVMSLQGSNPPKAKAPQGTLYTPTSASLSDSILVKVDSMKIKI